MLDEERERSAEVGDDVFVEAGEGFEVFAEVVFFGEVEPGKEEAVELFLGARIIEHLVDARVDLILLGEVAVACGVEEGFIGEGIPKSKGEFGSEGVLIGLALGVAIEIGIEEVRRSQGEEKRAFECGVGIVFALIKDDIDIELALFGGERTGKGALGDGCAEFAEF